MPSSVSRCRHKKLQEAKDKCGGLLAANEQKIRDLYQDWLAADQNPFRDEGEAEKRAINAEVAKLRAAGKILDRQCKEEIADLQKSIAALK